MPIASFPTTSAGARVKPATRRPPSRSSSASPSSTSPSAKAFYAPGPDYIQIPRPEAYFEPINWHRTALHELGHWSGHPSRLARDLSGGFGSKAYAREELVAEMTSAFCCASLGITPTVRHADYIGAWLEVLREDNRAIVRAASAASKAADYLLAFAPGAADALEEEDRAAA